MNQSRYAPAVGPPPASADEAATQAALADLGVSRRDHIATQEAGRGLTAREERAERLRARDEATNRRITRENAAAAGDDIGIKLTMWNNPSNFECDYLAKQSADINGGQSHRARITQEIQSGQTRDIDNRRYQQERDRFLRSRDSNNVNYVAEAGPSGTQRGAVANTPRSHQALQSAPIPTNSNAGRPPPDRPEGHTRAPSPRAAGRTRFGCDGRRTEVPPTRAQGGTQHPPAPRPSINTLSTAPRATASTSNGPSRATALPSNAPARPAALQSNGPPRPSLQQSTVSAPAACAPPTSSAHTAPPPSTDSASASTPSQPQRPPSATTPTLSTAPASVGQGAPDKDTLYQLVDYIHQTQMQLRALRYAAEPGPNREEFLRSYPDAAKYLKEARRRIVNEVSRIALRSNEGEIERYAELQKSRTWMVVAAIQAKILLDDATKMEKDAAEKKIREYLEEHEDQKDFLEAAQILKGSHYPLTSNKEASASATTSTNSAISAAAQLASPSIKSSAPTASATDEVATASAKPCKYIIPAASTTTGTVSDALKPTQTSAQGRGSINSAAQPANGSITTSSSRSSLRSADTNVMIPPSLRGIINVTFVDSDGNFLGHDQVKVEAPVTCTFTVNSKSADYDPRAISAALKDFAESKLVYHQDVAPAHRVESAIQHADGIWDEDEEL